MLLRRYYYLLIISYARAKTPLWNNPLGFIYISVIHW